jgi:hypothetical protein
MLCLQRARLVMLQLCNSPLLKTLKAIGLLTARSPRDLTERVVSGVEGKDISPVVVRSGLETSRLVLRLLPMRRKPMPADTITATTMSIGRQSRMLITATTPAMASDTTASVMGLHATTRTGTTRIEMPDNCILND